MRIRPRRQWLRLRTVGSSGRITIDAGSGCGRILTALLQTTAHDGWRKRRAARAFEDVLRQLAELLQRGPRCGILRREIVAGAARIAILLGQREQAAQRVRALVEPAL